MAWTNYHSHTKYCDGSSEHDHYVQAALEKGLAAYGFSSHAPVDFYTDWCVQDIDFTNYLEGINKVKDLYGSEIQIYKGLEIDFIPGVSGRHRHLNKDIELDYFIGSIHFVDQFSNGEHWNIDTSEELFLKGLDEIFAGDIKKAASRFFELNIQMLDEDKPDIIGHLDKIKMFNKNNCLFREEETWYRNEIEKLLQAIKSYGTIVEINTRGYYRYNHEDLYPSVWIIERISELGIPVMINSDSHRPEEIISGFTYATEKLKGTGIDRLWSLIDGIWQGFEYNSRGLIL